MSDIEKLRNLFDEWGVGYNVHEYRIYIREGSPKVGGYNGFLATFDFTKTGEFIEVGVWEE